MVNTLKVKGRMVEMGFSQKDLAIKLGVSLPTISQKINNKRPMSLSEAKQIINLLKINEADLTEYFFYDTVA